MGPQSIPSRIGLGVLAFLFFVIKMPRSLFLGGTAAKVLLLIAGILFGCWTEVEAKAHQTVLSPKKIETLKADSFAQLFEKSSKHTVQIKIIADTEQSGGSGIIWSPDGYILTNAHVISDFLEDPLKQKGLKILVYVSEKVYYFAKVIGADTEIDVALLKIDGPMKLDPAIFGDSGLVKPGDWVYTIGFPFHLGKSITMGVVSGLHRNANSGIQELIQIDAALNPGNSGGPLYNLRGEVVGMNVAIASGNSLGFSIPINDVLAIAHELKRGRGLAYAGMGVSLLELAEISQETAKNQGLPWPLGRTSGVMIAFVEPESPASSAGLKKGDIVLFFNHAVVEDLLEFRRLVARSAIGVPTSMVVQREGREVRLSIVLKERPMKKLSQNGDSELKPNQSGPISEIVGHALEALPSPVGQAITEYQGIIAEESLDYKGKPSYRFTNGFLVDAEHVVSVFSFINPNMPAALSLNYYFNGLPLRLEFVEPEIGIVLFKLGAPYPHFRKSISFLGKYVIGNTYFSLIMKSPKNSDAVPYQEVLKNKHANGLLAFTARIKSVGLGAPIFSSRGELVGMWLFFDKDSNGPGDTHDVTYAVSSRVIKKFIDAVANKNDIPEKVSP